MIRAKRFVGRVAKQASTFCASAFRFVLQCSPCRQAYQHAGQGTAQHVRCASHTHTKKPHHGAGFSQTQQKGTRRVVHTCSASSPHEHADVGWFCWSSTTHRPGYAYDSSACHVYSLKRTTRKSCCVALVLDTSLVGLQLSVSMLVGENAVRHWSLLLCCTCCQVPAAQTDCVRHHGSMRLQRSGRVKAAQHARSAKAACSAGT